MLYTKEGSFPVYMQLFMNDVVFELTAVAPVQVLLCDLHVCCKEKWILLKCNKKTMMKWNLCLIENNLTREGRTRTTKTHHEKQGQQYWSTQWIFLRYLNVIHLKDSKCNLSQELMTGTNGTTWTLLINDVHRGEVSSCAFFSGSSTTTTTTWAIVNSTWSAAG